MQTGSATRAKAIPIPARLRVAIAESNVMYCGLIREAFLAVQSRFEVVACGSGVLEITTAIANARPDVAVVSVNLQDGLLAGLQMMPQIRKVSPTTRGLLVLEAPDRELVIEAFRLGVDGVFSRNQSFELLCKSIEAVSRGQIWANTEELRYVLDAFVNSTRQRRLDPRAKRHLTKSESAVVSLAVSGLPNREIAVQLGLTEHTVKNYLYRVFNKLGVSNRVELVLSCLNQEEASHGGSTLKTLEIELNSAGTEFPDI